MTQKIGILISGEGTNLQAILDHPVGRHVALVISNNEQAFGLERAKKQGVATVVCRHQDTPSRELFEAELTRHLEAAGVGLVVLAGFMRLLGKKFVDRFRGRIMNIHPALLPSFPGTKAIERAWEAGVKVTGVTVHFVDDGVDTGPIVLQQAVPVGEEESLESLTSRIHAVEHRLYPEAIRLFLEGRVRLSGSRVMIRRGTE